MEPPSSRPMTPRMKPLNEREQLFIDIRRHNLDGLVQLLERDPELNRADEVYGVPIIYAVKQGNLPAIYKLIDHGADVNFNSNGTALHAAVQVENLEILDFLLDAANIDVTQLDSNDENALFAAVRLNNLAIVEKLVEHGTPVNVCNKTKQTPLTLAIQGKDERVLKYLLGHGADANGPGKHALKLARKLHLSNVESLLVMNGAREKPRKQHGSKLVEKGNQERLEVKRRRSEEQKLAPAGKCLSCGTVEGLLALIPCGHAVVCEACAPVLLKRTAQCPVCGLSFFATKKA